MFYSPEKSKRFSAALHRVRFDVRTFVACFSTTYFNANGRLHGMACFKTSKTNVVLKSFSDTTISIKPESIILLHARDFFVKWNVSETVTQQGKIRTKSVLSKMTF